ncbi:MAG: hypothetical protein HC866_17145 [Leptolyngbyaceae cyanobacterium RU_5_1]|nr:hypothetical protein [Leptolyngbyaceae cyanobacterium RU_5_1]
MYDNKIRLSQDVLEKAELIAQEWGLKNARAAVEAVFRKYADEYLGGRATFERPASSLPTQPVQTTKQSPIACEALNELDELLGL